MEVTHCGQPIALAETLRQMPLGWEGNELAKRGWPNTRNAAMRVETGGSPP
jgi:hypothetical protein